MRMRGDSEYGVIIIGCDRGFVLYLESNGIGLIKIISTFFHAFGLWFRLFMEDKGSSTSYSVTRTIASNESIC